jgi:hypothetical protein
VQDCAFTTIDAGGIAEYTDIRKSIGADSLRFRKESTENEFEKRVMRQTNHVRDHRHLSEGSLKFYTTGERRDWGHPADCSEPRHAVRARICRLNVASAPSTFVDWGIPGNERSKAVNGFAMSAYERFLSRAIWFPRYRQDDHADNCEPSSYPPDKKASPVTGQSPLAVEDGPSNGPLRRRMIDQLPEAGVASQFPLAQSVDQEA